MFDHHGRHIRASAVAAIIATQPNTTSVRKKNTDHDTLPTRSKDTCQLSRLCSNAFKIRRPNLVIGQQLAPGSRHQYLAGRQDVAAMRQAQRLIGVLLDEQDGRARLFVDLANGVEYLL